MIKDKRAIAWTPYGRKETVSILGQYLRREHERGVIDEWWLCLNTDPNQVDDLAYAYELARAYPWIKLKERQPGQDRRHPKQRNTGYFYTQMTDRDTVFLRIDDDIVYLHPDALERLAVHRLEANGGVASFPVMWNNSIISWFAQQAGVIPPAGTEFHMPDQRYTWPAVGGRFAVALHRLLLNKVESGQADALFLYQDYQLPTGMQFSVSVFASLGSMYADLPEPGILVPYEEEHWHTVAQPTAVGVPNSIVGDALVSHYTFFPQGPIVRATDILERYRALATKETN
jgi:hypothetical protein